MLNEYVHGGMCVYIICIFYLYVFFMINSISTLYETLDFAQAIRVVRGHMTNLPQSPDLIPVEMTWDELDCRVQAKQSKTDFLKIIKYIMFKRGNLDAFDINQQ